MDFQSLFQSVGGLDPIGGEGNFCPMDENSIAALERQWKCDLPASYREFLATFGACTVAESARFRPENPLPPSVSKSGCGLIDVFYGGVIDDGSDDYSLKTRAKVFRKQIGPEFVPIADDGGGSQICLGIQAPYEGQIFFWDIDQRTRKSSKTPREENPSSDAVLAGRNLYHVADSFEAFVETLEPLE